MLSVDTIPGEPITTLTIEQLQKAQEADAFFRQAKSDIDEGRETQHVEDVRGLIVRIYPVDGAKHIIFHAGLRQNVLFLGHYTQIAGHSGITKQYHTQRRTFYRPTMLADIHRCSNKCDQCA